ncbi:MAG: translocation/assembly module TamB domain-containing protein [Desulfobacteraceae bacterium]
MKRMRPKWIVLAAAAGLLFLFIAVITALVATEAGTRTAWRWARPFLPETVTVDTLEGRLIGPLVCKGIEVRTDTMLVQIARVELEWSPAALIHRKIDIQQLAVEQILLSQIPGGAAPPEEKPKPIALPDEIALPFDVNIDTLRLKRFEYRSGPEAAPLEIETLSLSLSVDEENADLSRLLVSAPRFMVKGSIDLSLKKNFAVKGDLDWRINPPAYPQLIGRTAITGNLSDLKIHQVIGEPYRIDTAVTIKDLLQSPRFLAELDLRPDQLNRLNTDLPAATLRLEANGHGDPENISVRISAAIEAADLGRTDVKLDAGIRSGVIYIDNLSVTMPDQPSQLTAVGQIPLKGERNVQFETHWHQLQWPLQQPRLVSPEGRLLVQGRIDDYTVEMTADVIGPEKTKATVKVNGSGTRKALNLAKIDMTSLDGGLSGTAAFGWSPELVGRVSLSGKGLNPGVIFESWPGDLQVQLTARGRLPAKGPEVKLQAFKIEGRLRGHPFLLDAQGAYENETATVHRLNLTSGKTRLEAQGTIGKVTHLSWEINSEDLSTLHPDARGRVSGKGMVTGPILRPQCEVNFNALEASYKGYRLKSLRLAADVDLAGEDKSSISMNLEGGAAPGVEIRRLDIVGHGDAAQHAFKLAADTSQGMAELEIRGTLRRPWQPDMTWDFQPVKAILSYPKLNAWTLQNRFSGEISSARLGISQSCWRSGKARICLSGQRTVEKVQADFEIIDLPYSYFNAYLPDGLDLAGGFSGKGAYGQTGDAKPVANVLLDTSQTRVRSYNKGEARLKQFRQLIEFLPGRILFDMQQNEIKADIALPVSDTDGLALQAAISPGTQSLLDRPLRARLRTGFQNLEFIEAWLPEVESLSGRLTGDVSISGSLRHPSLNGRLALIDGSARLERPGLVLEKIGLSVTGEENGGIRLSGRAVSGLGDLNIDGTADLRGNSPQANIQVKGRNFTVFNTNQAQVDASPDLKIGLRQDRIDVDGEVVIPKAKIEIKKLPESAVQVSDDQTIAGTEEGAAEEKSDRKINARVRITLGENVTFEGFGLYAGIQGGLLAIETPGEPTTGSGELRIVNGTYEAFGQKLDVEKGRVLFAGGPIDRPGIDARAVRRPAEGILVGVNVRGDLRQPDVTLFSDPAMTQGNQLSYLVLGRPLSGASAGEGSALSRAVLALGLKGGNVVAEKIGGKLGLDQFTVESNGNGSSGDAEQASLVIGKYLTPKLYINYGIGLFDPVSTLRLQYAISSNWKLVTESTGTASGGDFIYTIETGR